MTGKTLRNKLLPLWLLGLLLIVPSWVTAGPIVVLLSDSETTYNQPVLTFSEEVGRPISLYNLHGGLQKNTNLRTKIMAEEPELIFALGAKAAFIAKLWTKNQQDIPVLFALVLNWQRYQLLDQNNMAGIEAEMAPGTQFINMTMISPTVKRIGIVYGEQSATTIAKAQQAADLLGLKLVTKIIKRPQDFRLSVKEIIPQVDAYWLVNDPVIYTLANIDWLEDRCVKEKLVCVGQSANIAKVGLLLAVNPDPAGLGSQAASLANNILLGHQTPSQIGVMPPMATEILLNRHTSRRIGMAISDQALDLATKVIE